MTWDTIIGGALATIGALCLASWAAFTAIVWRETRNRREDREDTAINHGIPAAVPLPRPDASDEEFAAFVAQALAVANSPALETRFREALDNDYSMAAWLAEPNGETA